MYGWDGKKTKCGGDRECYKQLVEKMTELADKLCCRFDQWFL